MYSIYYIPNFVWKHTDVKGKIGVSEQPDKRVNKQGYTYYKVLETHDDIYVVSKRERELQKEYGLPIDTVPYFHSRKKWGSYAGKKGAEKNRTTGHFKKFQKIGSKIANELNKKPVLQFTKKGKFVKRFDSIKDAAKYNNISASFLSNHLAGRKKSANGFIFKWAD